LDEPFLGGT